MRLGVGLLGDSPGWRSLLGQEGTAWEPCREGWQDAGYPVVVAADLGPEGDGRLLKAYLRRGGAVLCPAAVFSHLGGSCSGPSLIRYCMPGGGLLTGAFPMDVYRRCERPEKSTALPDQRGRPSALVGEHGGGAVVVLPFDPGELFLDRRTRSKSFYAGRTRLPHERVSLVDKGGVRALVSRSIELLHHLKGLPYAHLWYYPDRAGSVFLFRVDTDRGSRASTERLGRLAAENGVPVTWFVDVKSQEKFLDIYSGMEGDEIGIHCYEHAVFRSREGNLDNIRRARSALNARGLQPRGFAAPFGVWNDGIAGAVDESGLQYSSEFWYDYDNLPSVPVVSGRPCGHLQVPVHPISIGNLRRQGCSPDEMREYYRRTLSALLLARSPAAVYHHPNDGGEEVLADVFLFLREQGIGAMRMGDFAAWWKSRGNAPVEAELEGARLLIRAKNALPGLCMRVSRPGGTEAFCSVPGEAALDSLAWAPAPAGPGIPGDILRRYRFNPWISINRLEDAAARIVRGVAG